MDWTMALAIDISNQFELGLNDQELRSLSFVISRRARKAAAVEAASGDCPPARERRSVA